MRNILAPIMLCIILFSAGLAYSQQESGSHEYYINNDDLLEITVYGEPDLSKTIRVSSEGTISYPLLGNIAVVGLTSQELETKITALLAKDYLTNPQVNVLVKEYVKIFVLGQVKQPGSYELKAGLTVIGAIALAGGLTDIAAPNQTKVIRVLGSKKQVLNVPVGSILKGGDRTLDYVLEPNDTIMVPESFF